MTLERPAIGNAVKIVSRKSLKRNASAGSERTWFETHRNNPGAMRTFSNRAGLAEAFSIVGTYVCKNLRANLRQQYRR